MKMKISRTGLPVINRAGQYPLQNPVFDFSYRNPTNALHLYDYDGRIRIGTNELIIHPGDITSIQAGTVYSVASNNPGKHWCIHYNDISETGEETIALPTHLHLGTNSLFYLEQIRLISRLFGNQPDRSENDPIILEARFRLKALLLALHNLGSNQPRGRRSKTLFSWNDLLEWVDENLDQSISVSMLAERANVSSPTLAKKFKQAHKTTLNQYLLHRRIDKAKSLLATTTLTIYEVGAAVGISDPQYFNKQFRKVTGISPSRYRNDNHEYLTRKPPEEAIQDGQWKSPSGTA